jgi:hypothetical protein
MKLKPCPFCGCTVIIDRYVYLKCGKCGAAGPKTNGGKNDDHADWVDHEKAIDLWNTRPTAQEVER